jgi:hypothetical protein
MRKMVLLAGLLAVVGRAEAQDTTKTDLTAVRPGFAFDTRTARTIGKGHVQAQAAYSEDRDSWRHGTHTTVAVTVGVADRLDVTLTSGARSYTMDSHPAVALPSCPPTVLCGTTLAGLYIPMPRNGTDDAELAATWRLSQENDVFGTVAVRGAITLPTGIDRGDRSTYVLSALASRTFGEVQADLNVGVAYDAHGGSFKPALLASGALRVPLSEWFGISAELSSYRYAYRLRSTDEQLVTYRVGPSVTLSKSLVIDAGISRRVSGEQPSSSYLGVTWHAAKAW